MKFLFSFVLFITVWVVAAQDSTYKPYKKPIQKKESFWEKVYAGGDIMVYGGTGSFYFNLSPLMGYRPNNKGFSYGIGATYQYSSFRDVYGMKYSYSLYGVRGFLRQNLGELFFLHAEYENYFTEGENIFTGKKELITIPCANAFIGYRQNFSEYSYYYIMLGYEFIGDRKTPYYAYPLHPLVFKAGYILDIKGK